MEEVKDLEQTDEDIIDYINEYGSEKLKFNENSPKFELKSDEEFEKEGKNR